MEPVSCGPVSPVFLKENPSCRGQPSPARTIWLEIHLLHPTVMVGIIIQPGRTLRGLLVNWKEEQPSYLPRGWLRSWPYLALYFILVLSWSYHLMATTLRERLQKD